MKCSQRPIIAGNACTRIKFLSLWSRKGYESTFSPAYLHTHRFFNSRTHRIPLFDWLIYIRITFCGKGWRLKEDWLIRGSIPKGKLRSEVFLLDFCFYIPVDIWESSKGPKPRKCPCSCNSHVLHTSYLLSPVHIYWIRININVWGTKKEGRLPLHIISVLVRMLGGPALLLPRK